MIGCVVQTLESEGGYGTPLRETIYKFQTYADVPYDDVCSNCEETVSEKRLIALIYAYRKTAGKQGDHGLTNVDDGIAKKNQGLALMECLLRFGEAKSIDIDMGLRDDDDRKTHAWRTERFVICQKCKYKKTIKLYYAECI